MEDDGRNRHAGATHKRGNVCSMVCSCHFACQNYSKSRPENVNTQAMKRRRQWTMCRCRCAELERKNRWCVLVELSERNRDNLFAKDRNEDFNKCWSADFRCDFCCTKLIGVLRRFDCDAIDSNPTCMVEEAQERDHSDDEPRNVQSWDEFSLQDEFETKIVFDTFYAPLASDGDESNEVKSSQVKSSQVKSSQVIRYGTHLELLR